MKIKDRSKERLGKVYPLFVSWEPLPDGRLKGTPVGLANSEMFLEGVIYPETNSVGEPCHVLKINSFSKGRGGGICASAVFSGNPPIHETLWIASEAVLRLAMTLSAIAEECGGAPAWISSEEVQAAINGSLNDDED